MEPPGLSQASLALGIAASLGLLTGGATLLAARGGVDQAIVAQGEALAYDGLSATTEGHTDPDGLSEVAEQLAAGGADYVVFYDGNGVEIEAFIGPSGPSRLPSLPLDGVPRVLHTDKGSWWDTSLQHRGPAGGPRGLVRVGVSRQLTRDLLPNHVLRSAGWSALLAVCTFLGIAFALRTPTHRSDMADPRPGFRGQTPPTVLEPERLRELEEVDAIHGVLTAFQATLSTDRAELEKHLTTADLPGAASVCHRLRGSCLQLGASAAADALRAVEWAASQEDLHQAKSLMPAVRASLSSVESEVADRLRSFQAQGS